MKKILEKFNEIKSADYHHSHMQKYMDILKEYAEQCSHITEMGVAGGGSIWAFLAARPNVIRAVDIDHNCPYDEAWDAAKRIGVDYKFILADTNHGVSAKLNIRSDYKDLWDKHPVPYYQCELTDLLFIDTYHHYESLKKELDLHAPKAQKFIILHDIEAYRYIGEHQSPKGLMPAIQEFLKTNPQWVVDKDIRSYPGLFIMRRK